MHRPRLLARLLVAVRRLLRNDQLLLGLLAVVIGVAAAGAEIGFRALFGHWQALLYGASTERLASLARALPWWQVVGAPMVGGLVVGLFLKYLMPGGAPQGVAHVMEATALRQGRISVRAGIGAAIVSALSLGSGASTGREGPVVHLGATIGSAVARLLGLPGGLSRTLLGCGVAAAVAASFNAPFAGVFFALEVVVGHYALAAFAPIVLAAVAATVVSRLYYGDYPAFILPDAYPIASFWEFPAFALLGVVSAGVAIVFMWSVMTADAVAKKVTAIPRYLHPMVGGLVVGIMALWLPEVLGVGYEATDDALRGDLSFELMVILIIAKTAATAICLGAGFGGGVFSPSLFVGAMLGGAFGFIATGLFPELSSGTSAYTLVGMGAVAGAVLGAPISTILIVFEMTGDYPLTIALMVAVVIASTITTQTLGKSLFEWQLRRRGISLKGGRAAGVLGEQKVAAVMTNDYATIGPDAPIGEVRERLRTARYGELFVVMPDDTLVGTLTIADLNHRMLDDEKESARLRAGDIAHDDGTVVARTDGLDRAVRIMDRTGHSHLPVVMGWDDRRLVGFLHEHDVMLAYHRALMDQERDTAG